jgi:SNF2 family DNA or RNA helicase
VTRTFTPHDYQREALDHLYSLRRSVLWMPMGGGKTVTVLTALSALDTVEEVFPALVLAPKRVVSSTWPQEAAKWAHTQGLRVVPVLGTAKQREAALRLPADVYATNYDNVPWLVAHCGEGWPFKTVIADELTRLKSYRTRQGGSRARALAKVAHTKSRRFIGLTGTPAPNGLKDLWGQVWFVDRGERLGRTFSAFEARWFTKGWDGYSLQPREFAQAEIEDRLKDVCLTVKGLDVDEPIRNVIEVELPKDARKTYEEMERDMWALIEGEGVEAVNAAVRTSKCLQLSNGAVYREDGSWVVVHDEKIDALKSVVEEANGMPVLVAYNFKSDLARILAAVPGAKPLDDNPKTIVDWNAGRIPVLVAHPASAGHGLNLQDGGNILAFFGLNWNLEEHDQIIERVGPQRQKQSGYDRPVFIHYILAKGTVDAMVMDRLVNKRSVQDVLLEAMRRRAG